MGYGARCLGVLVCLVAPLAAARTASAQLAPVGVPPGVVRVEDRVSERFSSQAKRLSHAYEEVAATSRTYRLLQVTPSLEWQSLQEKVVNEVERQRRWLQDLNIVLEPALLRAKLAMLPPEQEQSLWVRSTTNPNKD